MGSPVVDLFETNKITQEEKERKVSNTLLVGEAIACLRKIISTSDSEEMKLKAVAYLIELSKRGSI
jgi:hypothetical protein